MIILIIYNTNACYIKQNTIDNKSHCHRIRDSIEIISCIIEKFDLISVIKSRIIRTLKVL